MSGRRRTANVWYSDSACVVASHKKPLEPAEKQVAIKGVNTEIRNTQSQLRDVDKLLKLDPGNMELLAQKHRLLGDAVKETKEEPFMVFFQQRQGHQTVCRCTCRKSVPEGEVGGDESKGCRRRIGKAKF